MQWIIQGGRKKQCGMLFAVGVFPPPSALAETINSTVSRRRGKKRKWARTRRFGLAVFLVWRESGDDFPERCLKSRPLAFPKWKYYETTNQHLQNKTSLSTLIIIIIGRAEQWKGSSTALCNSNKFPGKNKNKKTKQSRNWGHMLHYEVVMDGCTAADKLQSDCSRRTLWL